MKKFIARSALFITVIGVLYLGSATAVHFMAQRAGQFAIDTSKHILIMGNSCTQCAIDTKYIHGAINYSNSAEHYMYTYLKLKQIVKDNTHIDTLLLGYTQRNADGNDSGWLVDPASATLFVSVFHPIMGFDEFMLYIKNRPSVFANLKLRYFLSGLVAYSPYISWLTLGAPETSGNIEKAKAKFKPSDREKRPTFDADSYQLKYLGLIRDLCRTHNIKLLLITPPMYDADQYSDTTLYADHYRKYLSDIPMLDYRFFPVADSCFFDLVHLNVAGAKVFSEYIARTHFKISK